MSPEQPVWGFRSDEDLLEHMDFLFTTYGFEDDDNLSLDAIDLKNKLLQHLSTWIAIHNRKEPQ